eukprot:1182217-Prorocentrum_minimum.AAC.1
MGTVSISMGPLPSQPSLRSDGPEIRLGVGARPGKNVKEEDLAMASDTCNLVEDLDYLENKVRGRCSQGQRTDDGPLSGGGVNPEIAQIT